MRRKPHHIIRELPQAVPIWVLSYEVWKGEQHYRKGTMRIPADTEQEAQQSVEMILRDLMPNLFLDAEVRLTSTLTRETCAPK